MKIKVGVREYKLISENEIIEVGGELYGKCDHKEETITIANKFPKSQQNETFIHEMIHALANMQDLREIDNNEHWVSLISSGLYMIIKDNPHIFNMVDITEVK